ncbi:glycosyltransferase family 2 protein [Affinibrenneria salicis]|uniref:Glycosyltransferase family 2 protein n=1 Tax=Affinibrenneria salicis TaxID=2590031 RepID=A0A5J5FU63_9GAMM|nr:glycosyltransferase family A protein [Affinibrenneria salicis]KAA8996988.1 glycosyltransferase family 2 protein [Affinibrenneria salicis]
MNIMLSLIIPVYKVEAYIEDCLNSVLSQLPPWAEVILVNDGSPDDAMLVAGQVIERFVHLQRQIIILEQPNQGLSAARNTGIGHARGRYIGFLDSDDLLLADYFNLLGRLLADNPQADIVAFNARRFSAISEGHIQSDGVMNMVAGNDVAQDRGARLALLQDTFNRGMWYAWARIYHATLFEGARFPRGRNFEDIHLIPQLYLQAQRFVTCTAPLVAYRCNPDGITRAPKRRDLDDLDHALSHAALARHEGQEQGLYSILYVTTLKARLLVGLECLGLASALRETIGLKRSYPSLNREEQRLLSRRNLLFYHSPLSYYLAASLRNRVG